MERQAKSCFLPCLKDHEFLDGLEKHKALQSRIVQRRIVGDNGDNQVFQCRPRA